MEGLKLPRVLDQLEELEGTVKTELRTAQLAARVFTLAKKQRAVSTAIGTPTELAGSKKRGASSPPNLDTLEDSGACPYQQGQGSSRQPVGLPPAVYARHGGKTP